MDSSGKLPTMNEGRVKKGAIRVELDGGRNRRFWERMESEVEVGNEREV